MGIILPRFRKKTPVELLEKIEEEIKELEACNVDTERRHRNITRQFMLHSSGFCVVAAVFLYFRFPFEVENKIIAITVSVLSPILYFLINRIISSYYGQKIQSIKTRFNDLKKKKKLLIDEIMDKETYKVAKTILEKYAPEALPTKYPERTKIESNAIRQTSPLMVTMTRSPQPSSILPYLSRNIQSQIKTAPVFPRDKSYIDRMFEYLIGEGPSSKFALICTNCSTHNGMSLVEEFEYTAFKCYACNFLNPARKQRPQAPKLNDDEVVVEEYNTDTGSNDTEPSEHDGSETQRMDDDIELSNLIPKKDNGHEVTQEDASSNLLLQKREEEKSEDSCSLLSPSIEEVEISSSLCGNKSSDSLCNGSNNDELIKTDSKGLASKNYEKNSSEADTEDSCVEKLSSDFSRKEGATF